MKIAVLVAAEVDRELLDPLQRDDRFAVTNRPTRSEDDLVEGVRGAEVLVTRHHNRVTPRVLAAADRLRLIVQGTSGLDNIDPSVTERGIEVVGVPGENANAVAELVVGLMIALTRTVPEYDRMVRDGRWERDDCATRRELRSHRLGIVGLGRVGTHVAGLAASFGVAAKAFDPYLTVDEMSVRGAQSVVTLDDLLRASEILSLHVPLTEETRGMIGAREIALLPQGAIVINTARGEVADREALLEALESNHLGGLALDVYDGEPPEPRWPDDSRLLLTPHIAGCTREARASIGRTVYRKLCEACGFEPFP